VPVVVDESSDSVSKFIIFEVKGESQEIVCVRADGVPPGSLGFLPLDFVFGDDGASGPIGKSSPWDLCQVEGYAVVIDNNLLDRGCWRLISLKIVIIVHKL